MKKIIALMLLCVAVFIGRTVAVEVKGASISKDVVKYQQTEIATISVDVVLPIVERKFVEYVPFYSEVVSGIVAERQVTDRGPPAKETTTTSFAENYCQYDEAYYHQFRSDSMG